MKKTNILLLAIVCSLLSLSNQPALAVIGNKTSEVDTVKVLTIGNSFANNACRFLDEIAGSVEGCVIIIGRANLGGHSLEQHAGYIKQSEEDPDFKAYARGTKSLKDFLIEEEWDAVTIQQVSPLSFVSESFQPYADEIVDHVKEHSPNSQIYIHQTWAYAPDAPRLGNLGITYEEMYEKLTANYLELSERYDDAPILRSGDAFYNSYEMNNEIDLWNADDRFHASLEGSYLGGCVWFSELFKKDPAIITFIPDGMSEETAKHLREAAISVSSYDSISVQGVSINSCPADTLFENGLHQLNASVFPYNAGEQSVTWSSSNEEVATVDETGLVTLLSGGETTITVKTNEGGFSAECLITVDASLALEQIKEEIKNIFTGKRGLYALWYGGRHEPCLTQAYISGGQLFYQWGALELEKGQYDFSKIAEDLKEYREKGIYTTLQINGNIKPDWLYKEVPYHPERLTVQIRDREGSLMYWHQTFIDAHLNFLKALAEFIKENDNSGQILGIRQNFNALGTEHIPVAEKYRDLEQWIIPDGVDDSIELKRWSEEIGEDYREIVVDKYVELFADEIKIFVRNGIDPQLKARYKEQFITGKLSWFHTSSEVEPRRSGHVERQYQRFYDYARAGKTDAFAEPWASAWGDHGGGPDDRWCSPPKWNYWRLLFDLHCGVSYIGIYASDMRVAIEGIYDAGFHFYQDGPEGHYQREFTAAFEFAAKYAGHQVEAKYSPGAWIAFRENHTTLAENNIPEEERRLNTFTDDYTFLVERLPDNCRGQGIINIGPEWQRYGAWARILPSKEEMNLKINKEFVQNCEGKELRIKVIYYDAEGEDFDILINNQSHSVKISGEDLWKIKEIELDNGILEENDKDAHIKIKAGSGDIYLHMVKIEK